VGDAVSEVCVIVCGSREWDDVARIETRLNLLRVAHGDRLVIVHGCCPKGADRIAAEWCKRVGVKEKPFPADWHKHGHAAGPIRNLEMAQSEPKPHLCLAFWVYGTRGTKDMIDTAASEAIPIEIHPEPRR
jgi:hypothetical protein